MTMIRRQRGYFVNPFAFGNGGGIDPHYADVETHLSFDGTDGSTTFTDHTGKHSYTYSGSGMTLSNGQTKYNATSGYNNSNVTGVRHTDTSIDYAPGTSEFTLEWWQYVTSTAAEFVPVDMRAASGGSSGGFVLLLSSGTSMTLYNTNNTTRITATSAIVTNTWQFYCVDRYGGTTTLSIGGASAGSFSDSTNYNDVSTGCVLTAALQTGYQMPGYISDFRYTKGYSRRQGSYPFTVPAAAFPRA